MCFRYVAEFRMGHPTSRLDVDFLGEWEDSADVIGLNTHFKWKTVQGGQVHTYSLKDQYKKKDREAMFEVQAVHEFLFPFYCYEFCVLGSLNY